MSGETSCININEAEIELQTITSTKRHAKYFLLNRLEIGSRDLHKNEQNSQKMLLWEM